SSVREFIPVCTLLLSGTLLFTDAARGALCAGRNCTSLTIRVMVASLGAAAIVDLAVAINDSRTTPVHTHPGRVRLIAPFIFAKILSPARPLRRGSRRRNRKHPGSNRCARTS